MRALLVVLLVLGVALAATPAVHAYPEGCAPDDPCQIEPCDTKCLLVHTGEVVACIAPLRCLA